MDIIRYKNGIYTINLANGAEYKASKTPLWIDPMNDNASPKDWQTVNQIINSNPVDVTEDKDEIILSFAFRCIQFGLALPAMIYCYMWIIAGIEALCGR